MTAAAALRGMTAAVAIVGLAACAQAPFVDSTQAELTGGTVRICYNSRDTTPAEIVALAEEACAEKRLVPQFVKQENYQCRLLAPTQVTYRCVKAAR